MSAVAKTCSPGRPKDPEKHAAILEAAKRLFPQSGFEGTSMDAIAAAAGVSKLTVYSHFTDKETLFFAAIRAHCEEQMPATPATLFDIDPRGSLRQHLETIARAFFAMVMAPRSIALYRVLVAGVGTSPRLSQMFWDAGPQRIHAGFQQFLQAEIRAGHLRIEDVQRASAQFFALVKGEFHMRQLCGCAEPLTEHDIQEHVRATVEFFLRAYARRVDDPADR